MQMLVKVDSVGDIIDTPKGYLREYLAIDNKGKKCVIKIFSKNKGDLEKEGVHERLVEVDNFCFQPRA